MPQSWKILAAASSVSLLAGIGIGVMLSPDLPPVNPMTIALANPTHQGGAGAKQAQPTVSTDLPQSGGFQNDKPLGKTYAEQLLSPVTSGRQDFSQAWRTAGEKSGFRRDWARSMIMANWMEADPQGAIEFLQSSNLMQRDRQTLIVAYSIYASQDLQAALASLEGWPDSKQQGWAREGVLDFLANTAPMQGLELWISLDQNQRNSAEAILRNAYAQNPAETIAKIQSLPATEADSAFRHLISAMSQDDPDAALQLALRSDNQQLQQQSLHVLFSAMSENDLDKAFALHEQLPENIRQSGQYINRLIYSLGQRDAEAAIAYLEQHPELMMQAEQTLVSAMSQKDPYAAWDYVMANQSSNTWNSLVHTAFNKMVLVDLEKAHAILQDLPESQMRNQLTNQYINQLANTDMQTALDFAYQSGNADIERQAIQAVINKLSRDDPQMAVEFAVSNRDIAQPHVVANAVNQWFRQDKDASLAWLQQLEDSDFKSTISDQLIMNNAYNDPDLSAKLLGQLSISPEQMTNVQTTITRGYASRNVEQAIEYAMNQDGEIQKECLKVAFQQFKNSNPAKAQSALVALPISNDLREQLNQQVFTVQGNRDPFSTSNQ